MLDFGVTSKQKQPHDSVKLTESVTISINEPAFDLALVKSALEPYRMGVEELLKEAEEFEIKTDADIEKATNLAGVARRLSKLLEDTKLSKTKSHREFVAGANGLGKMFTDPLERVVRILKKKGEEYAYRKIIEQRKREAEEKERIRKLQDEVDKKAKDANVESVTLPAPAIQEFSGVTRSESGSSLHVRLVWKGVIVSPKSIPREYCEPSQRLIDEAVAGGVREIEGVRIKEVPESRLRA